MIKKLMGVGCVLLSLHSYAGNVVDVYGADPKTSATILKKYGARVSSFEAQVHPLLYKDEKALEDFTTKNRAKREKLIEEIKQSGHFLWVDLQTVIYPGEKDTYTTIEVVTKEHPERLRLLDKKTNKAPEKIKADVIGKMQEYDQLFFEVYRDNPSPKSTKCPVYHCTYGFDHPRLKPYLSVFNNAARLQKKFILNTLANDPNTERRSAAAFLVGHFNDPREIINSLLPYINDKNSEVRNNTIRVIAETLMKSKIRDLDINPFLALLESPYEADRNKSLAVIMSLADSSSLKPAIMEHADQLVGLLKLKQPNNSEFAYLILKKISGKNYGAKEFSAWDKWLNSVQQA